MLEELLAEKRQSIVKKWRELTLDTYPEEGAKFFKREGNAIANPVGSNISRAIEDIFDVLAKGGDFSSLAGAVDDIVRIRAVQEFSASRAVGFVFLLKDAVREEVGKVSADPILLKQLLEFESTIDALALFVFEAYMGCREQIFRIKATELHDRSRLLLERVGAKVEMSCPGSGPAKQ